MNETFPHNKNTSQEMSQLPKMPEQVLNLSGIGMRSPHIDDILSQKPELGFLEVHSENYFNIGGIPYRQLEKIRELYPISLHGVGLSLGSNQGIDKNHLDKIKILTDIFEPIWVSEHLSWSMTGNISVPDLLPLPMTYEALDILSSNISHVQDTLKRSILVENPSAYMAFEEEDMSEPDFLIELTKRTGCRLLLDINNIHVSAHNMGGDTDDYLSQIPKGLVDEIHLAGYQINNVDGKQVFIDAHNNPVYSDVWDLYEKALTLLGDIPTLIEWDNDLPSLDILVNEAKTADSYRNKIKNAIVQEAI